MSRSRKALVTPFVETDAEVIERGAVCIEAFTVRPVYRNKLRRQVQNQSELHFLPSDLFLGRLALGDIDHSTHDLNELARSVEDYMAYAMNVPDPFVRMNDSVVQVEIHLVADGFLD